MTFNELIALVPEDKRHLDVEWEVEVGEFPSGEEGAEDWIMGARLVGVEVVHIPAIKGGYTDFPEWDFIRIEVLYS